VIRAWRYGANFPTPFMPGESALVRAPVIIDGAIIFANNQEAKVMAIERSIFTHEIEDADAAPKWTASLYHPGRSHFAMTKAPRRRFIYTPTSASSRASLSE
jgi:hypothetical protein